MGLDIELNQDSVGKLEKFLVTSKYKELAESAMSFNRKLNEERKMRIPYVDNQTGVAQRHYDILRKRRERMPGRKEGQILSYPQRKWFKKRYQYLQYFMLPKGLRFEANPATDGSAVVGEPAFQPEPVQEIAMAAKENWEFYDDDAYAMQEPIGSEPESDSDFEYEGGRVKKGKGRKGGPGRGNSGKMGQGTKSSSKRRGYPEEERTPSSDRSSRASRRSVAPPPQQQLPPPPPPQHRAQNSDYCDFCLGDSINNKKTGGPEELIGCSICGRAGHPTCLQFTKNMMLSVRKYPWQCIECKSCTLCGTSENDDKLLFCDDCDRGYHMYCLVPPMKDAPEGSWSCSICIETFHKK